jgi:hypothetical protein
MPKDGYYFDIIPCTPPAGRIEPSPEEFGRALGHYSDQDLEFLRARTEQLHAETDYAIVGHFFRGGLGDFGTMAGLDREEATRFDLTEWLTAHVAKKSYVADVLAAQAENAIANLELYRQAVGDRIEVIALSGTDFGTQRSELFSPRTFCELYLPHFRRLNRWVKDHTNWKIFYHCCGSIYHLIGYLVDAGVDILNPIQTSAANMDPGRIKEEFGSRLSFWGAGVDIQQTLPFGTPEQVRAQVQERMKIFGPGGGFVFSAIHNIQHGTPPENIVGMFEAAQEFGRYPVTR